MMVKSNCINMCHNKICWHDLRCWEHQCVIWLGHDSFFTSMIFMSQDGEGHKHFHPEWIYFKIGWSLNHIIVSSHIGATHLLCHLWGLKSVRLVLFRLFFIHQNRDLQPRLFSTDRGCSNFGYSLATDAGKALAQEVMKDDLKWVGLR